ncbi:contact-dependent growth inhibition system immunity protein [Martelella alba]|uniref:DUF1436 family protein n=1 Tax=Martelella alba TaxID=2590451 RepID=A0ABY2SE20_9HYPH|nr:contact-dependent growth inhibition system immunity protein [Martelella alba]TKI02390.1 DUF1436 family protein [Martelella alba]
MFDDNGKGYSACAKINGDFLCIYTTSGLGLVALDTSSPTYFLEPDAEDSKVGEAVISALSKSRTLSADEYGDFFNREVSKNRYLTWVAGIMHKYGYKNKQNLFRKMKSSSIQYVHGRITFSPSHHEKLESWSGDGLTDADDVILPASSSPAEIGAGLRLAFERCK